jgi:hypothetical protein
MSVAAQADVPLWSRRDATVLAVLLAAGAVLVALSWFFAAGRADAGDQLAFVTLAVVGTMVGVTGAVLWTAHGRRLINFRRALLLGTAPPPSADRALSRDLVAGASGKWFHRSDCLLAVGRGWLPSPREQHERSGRRACPGCQP